MNWKKSKPKAEFPLQSTYRCSKKEIVILASITADDINPLCLMTIVSRSQAAYKMRLEQPQAMFSFYQSSWPKLRKYANESFDIKQFLLSLATFFILKGCTPLLDDVTTENHAHPRFTGAYEPWGKNEIYTVVGTGQQRSQALHGGKINKIRLPIRSVFKLYPNGIVVNWNVLPVSSLNE